MFRDESRLVLSQGGDVLQINGTNSVLLRDGDLWEGACADVTRETNLLARVTLNEAMKADPDAYTPENNPAVAQAAEQAAIEAAAAAREEISEVRAANERARAAMEEALVMQEQSGAISIANTELRESRANCRAAVADLLQVLQRLPDRGSEARVTQIEEARAMVDQRCPPS